MASVSNSSSTSSNIYSALGAKNKGIGGLVSGLDTDSLVAALTSGTKAKIAKQGQDKQLLNWKMTAYRSMTTALRAFQTKSFSFQTTNSNTNIMSSAFFNTYKATSSSSKVSVSAGTSAVTGSFTIDSVKQLATAESVTSKTSLSTDLLLGLTDNQSIDAGAFTGETLKLSYNGTMKTIKLDSLNQFIVDGKLDMSDPDPTNPNANSFQKELQSLLDKAFTTKNVYKERTEIILDENDQPVLGDDGQPTTQTIGTWETVSNVQLSVVDGKLKLDSDSAKLVVSYDNDLLKVSEGDTNRVDTNTKIGAISAFRDVQGDVLKFNINGTEISVSKNDSLSTLMSKINGSDAGVRMTYSSFTDEFTITSKTTGGGENIVMRDVQGNLMNTLFGAQSGNGLGTGYLTTAEVPTSANVNSIDSLTAAQKKDFADKLKNLDFEMTINGVTKNVKFDVSKINSDKLKNGTYTIDDIYTAMNKSIENAFGTTDVKFKAELGADGQPTGKTIIDAAPGTAASLNRGGVGRGGIMDILGFTEPAGNAVLNLDYDQTIKGTGGININLASGETGTLEMTINGVTKQLQVTTGINFLNYEDKLTKAIKDAFGSDVANNLKISTSWGGDGGNEMVFKLDISDPNMSVSFGHGSSTNGKKDMYDMLGFGGTSVNNSNPANNGTKLGELATGQNLNNGMLSINDGSNTFNIQYDKNMSLQDLVTRINTESGGAVTAGIKDGQLSLITKSGTIDVKDYKYDSGDVNNIASYTAYGADGSGGILNDMFGVKGGSFVTQGQAYAEGAHKAGQNAEVIINGVVHSERSNTLTINGISITVKDVTEPGEAAIKVDVVSDPEDVVTRIKGWMDDYNALIYTLNSSINESKNRDYSPLTDEQKSQMTEDQIKTWEAEAKKGVLRNDNTLKDILAQLRQSLYTKVESIGLSLYDIGITTKTYSDPNENGQIEFDKNVAGGGEAKLRAMLENDPDKVRLLFTDANHGIAVNMNDIITKAASTSSVDRGSLVRIAGTEQLTGDNTSILGDKISAIDKFIASLKSRLESEYNRQWKKFSALELAVQKMSSQSSWLNQG